MLLSQLIHKTIYTGKTPRGITVGVSFSTKTYAIKRLLCSTKIVAPYTKTPDFAVNVSAISAVADGISLTHVRPVLPQKHATLFLALPVYSHDGTFLGSLTDGDIENFTLVRLYTDRSNAFSPSSIAVCRDAIFLRKEQPYPLGQRVPSPLLSQLNTEDRSVTKSLLRRALQRGKLIKLTLSLPPFSGASTSND